MKILDHLPMVVFSYQNDYEKEIIKRTLVKAMHMINVEAQCSGLKYACFAVEQAFEMVDIDEEKCQVTSESIRANIEGSISKISEKEKFNKKNKEIFDYLVRRLGVHGALYFLMVKDDYNVNKELHDMVITREIPEHYDVATILFPDDVSPVKALNHLRVFWVQQMLSSLE